MAIYDIRDDINSLMIIMSVICTVFGLATLAHGAERAAGFASASGRGRGRGRGRRGDDAGVAPPCDDGGEKPGFTRRQLRL